MSRPTCQDCLTPCRKEAVWYAIDEATPDEEPYVYCDDHAPDDDPGVELFRLEAEDE